MTLGRKRVTFRASSPVTNQSATCSFNIHIKDNEPPRVARCPGSFSERLAPGQKLVKISWEEPEFRDNVGIQHVMASFLPGHYFPQGRHHVLYQAADGDGNRARCGFTITIKPQPAFNPLQRPSSQSRPPLSQQAPRPRPTSPPSHDSRSNSVLQLPPPRLSPPSSPSIPKHCQEDVPPVPNGKMACLNRRRSRKCTPVCDQGHVFYQKFSSRPPTYLCSEHRVDWKITKFIPDCSPVKKTATVGKCAPGWEARDSYCVACPPGMYRHQAPLCQLCPKGTFAEKFGSSSCSSCPPHHHTTSLGTRRGSECIRSRGRTSSTSRPDHNNRYLTSLARRGRQGRGKVLSHYNSWLNEQPYRQRHG